MVEQEIEEQAQDKDSGTRSPLLMPVMEGNSLQSGDVADFLKSRLSLLRETNKPSPPVPAQMS